MAWLLIGLWLVGGVMLMLGWHTRVGGTMLTVALAVALLSDQQTYSNHLYLMLPVAALLTVADSGAAVSLDARRAGERDWVPGWPVWLLCAQISIVYAFAALAKLNPDFLSGSVVASYLRRDGLLAVPAAWRSLEPMLVMSLFAICSEAFLAFALWIPRWRPAALVVGLGLHLFIAGFLVPTGPLFVFSLLMLPLYLLFLDVAPEARVVVWDDGCGFCATWVRWFRRLDWMHALRFVPRSPAGVGGPARERGCRGARAADRPAQRRGARRLRRGHRSGRGPGGQLPLGPGVARVADRRRWRGRLSARRAAPEVRAAARRSCGSGAAQLVDHPAVGRRELVVVLGHEGAQRIQQVHVAAIRCQGPWNEQRLEAGLTRRG